MLLEQDIPMNYEEKMVDLNARNELDSWNPKVTFKIAK
jgi:hypothetical protein